MNVFQNPEIAGNYDAYYQTDLGRKTDQIEKNLIAELIADLPRKHLLELGCGTGHWTAFFETQGFDVTATDTSPNMLKQAENKKLKAKFLLADAQSLPFPDQAFELAATVTMLEFVTDREKAFREIYRILQPGGWLIIGVLNKNSVLGKNKTGDEVFKHARFFTPGELKNALEIFGTPAIKAGVYLTPDFNLLDGMENTGKTEPAFLAAIVQKTK